MSGHNKWSQIKRQKEVGDAKKSQIFGKLAKEISFAARRGQDQNANPDLRRAVLKAREFNMPKDNIDRAIEKGGVSLPGGGANLESVRYEAYGPGGVAIIIDVITDSKNRTVSEIKHLLSKNGGSLAGKGAAIWAFETVANGELKPKTT
ncbi:MAG TPA: YebC/PmpR family DNA-binding transcriptional regulator, partial [Candidatus Paceibacterota bacterium]